MAQFRMTIPTQRVLRALLAEPASELYGLQIGDAAGLASGTVHPILARLEGAGWLESHWEDINPAVAGRPPRRYYRLTPNGVQESRLALARRTGAGRPAPRVRPRDRGEREGPAEPLRRDPGQDGDARAAGR